jgi:uncharacterized cupredoxin-like copper-binding protein
MRKQYAFLMAWLVGLFVLVACAPATTGTENDGPSEPSLNDNEGENVVEVELVSYEIQMPMTLKAGTITFHVVNNTPDDEEHSFEIEGNGIEEELEHHLKPGEEASLTVDLAPGTYRVYCPVEDHAEEHGMEIQISVE